MKTLHQMMRNSHACTYSTADALAAEPGSVITAWCGEPGRIDPEIPGWVVAMSWREKRRWRREQRKAQQ
ncbi:hypothetical protein [Streptomyces sp. NPDC051554]|uniref:hypothetical protein n=1 Tax=Streptomyces sp. NPDC051554 TaxID=3365656 RepID=UPI0037BC1F96